MSIDISCSVLAGLKNITNEFKPDRIFVHGELWLIRDRIVVRLAGEMSWTKNEMIIIKVIKTNYENN